MKRSFESLIQICTYKLYKGFNIFSYLNTAVLYNKFLMLYNDYSLMSTCIFLKNNYYNLLNGDSMTILVNKMAFCNSIIR